MKKIMLIGDSIRMSYQPLVKDLLKGKAEVWGPDENCRFAKYTLWCIRDWLAQFPAPDIIHWNNGIHDIFHLNDDIGIFTGIDEYLNDLGRIYTEMKKTGAGIIWATTTPVNDRNPYCKNNEIDLYNAESLKLMRSFGTGINDLNSLIKKDLHANISEDLLHLSEAGQKACADAIVKYITDEKLI